MLDADNQPIYFIGVALPKPLNTVISRLMWQLYDEDSPRMLQPLQPHVTLLHPPALRGTMPDELVPRVQKAATPYLPLNIELSKIKFYDEQVCYLQAESFGLHSLYQKLIPALPFKVQAAQLRRDFSPHVTLAQIKHPQELNTAEIIHKIEQSLTLPIRFEVASLTCFKRILPRTYKPENI